MSDPRVYFAAERTLLAWVRSGITIVALGFVVARFGLFLALVTAPGAASAASSAHWQSGVLGIAFVAIGALVMLAALVNHRVFLRSLPVQDVPELPMPWLAPLLAGSLAFASLLLAAYLALL